MFCSSDVIGIWRVICFGLVPDMLLFCSARGNSQDWLDHSIDVLVSTWYEPVGVAAFAKSMGCILSQ